MSILVVENEPLVALAVAGALEHAGFHVLGPAASGNEALSMANARKPGWDWSIFA